MAGKRLRSFRSGDSAEYLALYLLSWMGLVQPIQRQEDIGIDFLCTIGKNEDNILSFGDQCLLQVKSSREMISYNGEDLDWFFGLELPFFVGHVDHKKQSLKLYSTSAKWFLIKYLQVDQMKPIAFKFRNQKDTGKIHEPVERNGKWHIDLGFPIIEINSQSVQEEASREKLKKDLRRIIAMERRNILWYSLKMPLFHWVYSRTGENIDICFNHYGDEFSVNKNEISEKMRHLSQPLICLALMFQDSKMKMNELKFIDVLKLLPKDEVPKEVKEKYPNLFKSE